MIKYGISKNYLQDWTILDAIREIYQNFIDFGEYDLDIWENKISNEVLVTFTNGYQPEDLTFLAVGESGKRDDKSTIGKHGEGLKMAFLVLTRENCNPILNYGYKSFYGDFYEDENLGKCFGFEEKELLNAEYFNVQFTVPLKTWEIFNNKQIKKEDVIFHSCYGDLVNKPAGEIYVGGLYVCNLEDITHAYNFNPEYIELDRDRKVPKSFDIEYYASKILQNSKNITIEDLYSRETNYIDKIPENLAKRFKPTVNKDGNTNFIIKNGSQKGEYAPKRIYECLMKDPINQKKIEKLRYSVSRKKTPQSLLKEFQDKYNYSFSKEAEIDFNILIKKSKEWKY